MKDLKSFIRDIPGFPKEGIIFKDITPLLRDKDKFKKAVDLLAGVGEVVLGRGNLVVRDRLDGRVAGGHVAPISTGGHVRGFGPESGRFQGSAA